jgi:phospholipid-binding lipoprotein MlaA
MKQHTTTLRLLLLAVSPLLTDCSMTAARKATQPMALAETATVAPKGKGTAAAAKAGPAKAGDDEVDEYAAKSDIFDPLQGVNRAIFFLNDKIYTLVFRPIGKGYNFILPRPVRKGIDNVFENVKYPVRVVNCTLQGKFKRAGQETAKFAVNTVGGVGGIFRPAEKIPVLANLPDEDTGQTLAKWGIPHGAYIVLPLLGPCSLRDTVGLAGDYALNPVNWPYLYWYGNRSKHAWTVAPPSANSLRSIPTQIDKYDTITKDAVDPYLSARSAYSQSRDEAAKN